MSIKKYQNDIYAGVLGKIIGVYLGRPVEGWSYEKIKITKREHPLLYRMTIFQEPLLSLEALKIMDMIQIYRLKQLVIPG